MLISHIEDGLILMLILTAAPLGMASCVGLVVSVIQASTQVQEQTILFSFKLGVVIFVIFLLSGWASESLKNYIEASLLMIGELGR